MSAGFFSYRETYRPVLDSKRSIPCGATWVPSCRSARLPPHWSASFPRRRYELRILKIAVHLPGRPSCGSMWYYGLFFLKACPMLIVCFIAPRNATRPRKQWAKWKMVSQDQIRIKTQQPCRGYVANNMANWRAIVINTQYLFGQPVTTVVTN